MVERKGDVFLVTRRSWQSNNITHVLALRQAEVRRAPAPSQGQDDEAVILDKGARFRVEKILYQEYLEEPETRERVQLVWERAVRLANERKAAGQRASAQEMFDRSMRSYWKTTVFHRFGGEVWLHTLIATGRVHAVSVGIVNEIYAQRMRDEAGRDPVSDPALVPPLSEGRALASSQGHEVVGVQHTKKYTGQLRDAARHADKKWKWHDEKWWAAHGRGLSPRSAEWWRRKSAQLQEEADRQWAVATEESDKAGAPYKGRDGGAREKLVDSYPQAYLIRCSCGCY